jgi:hypothetical protein
MRSWLCVVAVQVKNVDACIINVPLYPGTENLFNRDLINSMRRGSCESCSSDGGASLFLSPSLPPTHCRRHRELRPREDRGPRRHRRGARVGAARWLRR